MVVELALTVRTLVQIQNAREAMSLRTDKMRQALTSSRYVSITDCHGSKVGCIDGSSFIAASFKCMPCSPPLGDQTRSGIQLLAV